MPIKLTRLLWHSLKKFFDDNGFFLSAGITFYIVLSLVPLLLLLLSVLGRYLYSHAEVMIHVTRYLQSMMPNLDPKVMENVIGIVQHRRITGTVGLAALAWTSTMVFGGVRYSLNVVFKVERGRGFVHGLAVDLFLVAAAGLLLLASMLLTSGIGLLQHIKSPFLQNIGPVLKFLLKVVVPFLLTFGLCFLLYRVAPNRLPGGPVSIRAAWKAALFCGLLLEAAKQLFSWYLLHAGTYPLIYGSLSTVALLLLWIHYSAVIFVLGGEVAFFLEKKKGG